LFVPSSKSLWKNCLINDLRLWSRGYFLSNSFDLFIKRLKKLNVRDDSFHDRLSELVRDLNGHFALVIEAPIGFYIVSDRVKSIPIYYTVGHEGNKVLISDNPSIFSENCDIDRNSVLEIFLAGYTVNRNTIFKSLYQTTAAECLLLSEERYKKLYYYNYFSERAIEKDLSFYQQKLTLLIDQIFKDLIKSCNHRQIVIPLSGGLDSRLVLSKLFDLGYKNIVCFSYGSKSSKDCKVSSKIATKLGYRWIGIETSKRKHKKLFNSQLFNQFEEFSETMSSAPFYQDFYAMYYLSSNNLIDPDAIIINGNTGDFISGGHIPLEKDFGSSQKEVINQFINKHFHQWKFLVNEASTGYIQERLNDVIYDRLNFKESENLFGLLEFLEWSTRQSKHIVNMQRSYEFFKFQWRMPLWDNRMLDFWEKVPVKFKLHKKLYISMLQKNNWGGVWEDSMIYQTESYSLPQNIVRFVFKFIFIFLGRDNWKTFDKKYLQFFQNPTHDFFMIDFVDYIKEIDNPRDARSFRINSYLAKKGLEIEDFKL